MQQHTRPESQPLAEYANALEPHAAESRRESHCCIEIPGQWAEHFAVQATQ